MKGDAWSACPCASCARRRQGPPDLVQQLREKQRELHRRAQVAESEVAQWRAREAERLERQRRFEEWLVRQPAVGDQLDGKVQA